MQISRWYKRSKSFDQNDLRRWSLGFISGKEDRSPKYIFSVPKSILKTLETGPYLLTKLQQWLATTTGALFAIENYQRKQFPTETVNEAMNWEPKAFYLFPTSPWKLIMNPICKEYFFS